MSPTVVQPVLGLVAGLRDAGAWSPAALGTDEAWAAGDDDVGPDGDTVEITGLPVLFQDLLNRLTTPLGSYRLHPEYGSRLVELLNQQWSDGVAAAAAVAAEEACEGDPRILEAAATVVRRGETVRITIALTVFGAPNPANLVVGWDWQTLSLQQLEAANG